MAEGRSLVATGEAEYEAIEAAVMETARGRWFLAEFARRNRTADTQVLLGAIGRLEEVIATQRTAQDMDRVRVDLMEMARAISRTKSEIAAIQAPGHDHTHLTAASEALDGIVRTTEQATSDILEAAEHIQEAAWTLREDGANATLCDELDRRATEIYTACSFQDLTAQRTSRIVQTLRYLESRIIAMIGIWGGPAEAAAAAAPFAEAGPGPDLSQTDVDDVIVDNEFFPVEAAQQAPVLRAVPQEEAAGIESGQAAILRAVPEEGVGIEADAVEVCETVAVEADFVTLGEALSVADSEAADWEAADWEAAGVETAELSVEHVSEPASFSDVEPAWTAQEPPQEPAQEPAMADPEAWTFSEADISVAVAEAMAADAAVVDAVAADATCAEAESPAGAVVVLHPEQARDDAAFAEAFADIDSLGTREKLRRFT